MLKKINKKLLILAVVAVLAASFFVFREKIPVFSQKKEVKTTLIKKEPIQKTLSVSGEILSEEQVNLRFQTSGRLAWVGVDKGDYVEKWQVLASLDQRELQKSLKKELIDYMNTRWDMEQTRDDYDVNSNELDKYLLSDAAKRVLEKSQFSLDRSVLDVEINNIALEYSNLITPISGIVTSIDSPYAGINITPANAEITVANPNKMEIQAKVEEMDIGKVKKGQKAIITLDAYPEEEFTSYVKEIDFAPTTVRGGGTAYLISFDLPVNNSQEKYKLGMNADIDLILEEKQDTLTVPVETIKQRDSKIYVEVLEGEVKKEIEINTGIESEDNIEVIEGLSPGDKVIIPENE